MKNQLLRWTTTIGLGIAAFVGFSTAPPSDYMKCQDEKGCTASKQGVNGREIHWFRKGDIIWRGVWTASTDDGWVHLRE